MENIVQEPGNPMIFEVGIFALVLFFFFSGLIMRGMYEGSSLKPKQLFAGGVMVFFIFALPIGVLVIEAVKETQSLMHVMTACVPTFTFGVTMKEQLCKIIPDTPNAQTTSTAALGA